MVELWLSVVVGIRRQEQTKIQCVSRLTKQKGCVILKGVFSAAVQPKFKAKYNDYIIYDESVRRSISPVS